MEQLWQRTLKNLRTLKQKGILNAFSLGQNPNTLKFNEFFISKKYDLVFTILCTQR